MTLQSSRIVFHGETPYPHEREAIQHVIDTLPNVDPFHIWALLELLDPSTGRLYELDLLVLGYSALYLIEIKSGAGRYEGDHQDWQRTPPGSGRSHYMENPLRLNNHKAKVLSSRLRSKLANPSDMPWIEPLTFLSAKELELRFRNHGDLGVVTRDTLLHAVQFHRFPGSGSPKRRVTAPVMRDVAQALKAIGLRPRKGKLHAGAYELGEIVDEGPGYQDRSASHRQQSLITSRARTYLVPQQTSVERRQQLVRAADRESQILWDLREHPNILRITSYETDAPLGPTVLFDPFEGGVPLSTFLRQHPDLAFLDRVTIVEQVARALGFCHRKHVFHGAVSPEAVLVRRHPETQSIETRLFNFQLAGSAQVEATTHWSALAAERWAIYKAPELHEDPTARTAQSDVFSLGALAYHVFTGRAPGENFVEVARKLAEHRRLDPRAVDNGMPEQLAEVICMATELSPIQRADDADEWIELLLEETTRPDPIAHGPELDPLEARELDALDDFIVAGVLGHGATSRVLEVHRDGRAFALKIALSPEHHERLEHEAEALEGLRHPRIVQRLDALEIAGRACLLLSLAGSETLHRYLAQHGSVSLDLAARYGDDLLSALEYLEDEQVMHRDIKPANIGVGSRGKGAAHLTLFDFSLAKTSDTELQVGTAAYRDPFLTLRGRWDGAAERWSAAITLHEMLTGVRPSFVGAPLDSASKLQLAAERFDPSVREALVGFFERALAREADARFANAKEMRFAWTFALEASKHPPIATALDPDASPSGTDAPSFTDAQVAAIAPETLAEALPLSARAKNALDRAGVVTARDLLELPDNRISAVRGVGSGVAREIVALRNHLARVRNLTPDAPTAPSFPGYRGDDLALASTELSESIVTALTDAGLRTLAAIAAAPSTQLEALAQRAAFDVAQVRAVLERENRSANERAHPSTVEGWIDALLSPKSRMKRARQLYGLDAPLTDRLDAPVTELAEREQITPAAIYIALGKARDVWAQHPAIAELRAEVHEVATVAGGALPLRDAARHLLARMPHDRAAAESVSMTRAAALVRVVCELDKDDASGLRYVRIADAAWLALTDKHAAAAKALGAAADALAERDVIAGQGETERAFAEAVEGTPYADASPARLVELAAAASRKAASSTRLEIYPRGLSAERALALSAPLLRSEVEPDEVTRRVALRYPDAEPLPPRPALDALLAVHGLTWNPESGRYDRPSAVGTSLHTRASSNARARTAHPSEALSMEPDAVTARQFDERLRNAVERRYLRVLGVNAAHAREATLALADRLGVKPVAFDRLLIAAMREQMAQGGIRDDAVVHAADREGRAGPAWKNLLRLAAAASRSVADRILPPREPLLLVQLGPIVRYRLEAFRARLLEAAQSPEAASILLVVPSRDGTGIPQLAGEPVLPGLLASQALWVPTAWLKNRHNSAA